MRSQYAECRYAECRGVIFWAHSYGILATFSGDDVATTFR